MKNSLKSTLLSLILVLPFAAIPAVYSEVITEENIQEITKRLEPYSPDELLERREFLIDALQDEDSESDEGSGVSRTSMLLELSILEQLLIALGILMVDDITSGTSDPQDSTPPPPDTTPPVITVLGDNPATVELGDPYTDAGATADGGESVSQSGTVDVGVVGSYTITYTATDASGNTATATRTVNVVDTTAPVVTVTGDNPATVELGATYTDAGASATDFSQTQTLETTGSVDTDTVGTYTITYTATDASGNTATATRTVNVVDTTAPVLSLIHI